MAVKQKIAGGLNGRQLRKGGGRRMLFTAELYLLFWLVIPSGASEPAFSRSLFVPPQGRRPKLQERGLC